MLGWGHVTLQVRRWYLPPHQKQRQPFQPIASQSKDKGRSSAHQRDALCRRCCPRHALEEALQQISRFTDTCREFSLTISLKKANIMGQHVDTTPTITIEEQILEVVDKFTYLGSTIFNNLFLDAELNVRTGKASTTMAHLSKRVWENTMLTLNTKMRVYRAFVLSTLLYGSESWTLYSHQEQRLNAFHMWNFRRLLGLTWQEWVTNASVLA